jgi:hypothetical protein
MKDEIICQYENGYFNSGDDVRREDGCMIAPSSNVIYSRDRKPVSLKDVSSYLTHGGSRSFVLDDDLLGFLGTNSTSNRGSGSMLQSVGKSLWFVGNTVTNGVKVNVPSTDTEIVIGDLSSIPQLSLWSGSSYSSPVQVGLAEQDTPAELILTTEGTKGADFTGLLTGSTSVRLARKRVGTISIASPPSNVVTGAGNTVYVTIPAVLADDAEEWVLYFTYRGRGSTFAHLMFPIVIPENELDGTITPSLHTTGNAKAKVVSTHASTQSLRKVEIEFYDNDLLLLSPFDDHYSADSCKFMFQLGNHMCLVGTGEFNTGFDVSKPSNFEAFAPEDRDWMSEEPVAIASSSDMGFTWILTKHCVYQAVWTGAKSETAPISLRQVSSIFGAIGENSCVSINGVLYFLSAGKTPIRVTPDGLIDKEFGTKVKNSFSSYTANAVLDYDEQTNSVVWIDGNSAIAFQIDNEIWTAPLDLGSYDIDSALSYNGSLYLCYHNSGYKTYKYNSSGDLDWNATSNFRTGKGGLALKDIIEGRLVTESESSSYTITVKAYKDFSTSSAETLFSYTGSAVGAKISVQKWIEALDYTSASIRVEGTKGGQTIHLVSIMFDVHAIEKR